LKRRRDLLADILWVIDTGNLWMVARLGSVLAADDSLCGPSVPGLGGFLAGVSVPGDERWADRRNFADAAVPAAVYTPSSEVLLRLFQPGFVRCSK
jgi:hypothetical protein